MVAGAQGGDVVVPPFLAVVFHADRGKCVAQQDAVGLLLWGEPCVFRGRAGIQQVMSTTHVQFLAGAQVDEGDIHRDSPAVLGGETDVLVLINAAFGDVRVESGAGAVVIIH